MSVTMRRARLLSRASLETTWDTLLSPKPHRTTSALMPNDNHRARHRSLSQTTTAAPKIPDLYKAPTVDLTCDTRTATIALVGAPNAGKSSLSNGMIERRVSAVSRKVNTTRACTAGVYTHGSRQLVLLDTPGLVEREFVPTLGRERRALCTEGWGTAASADVAAFVIDASRGSKYWRHYARVAAQLADVRAGVGVGGRGSGSGSGSGTPGGMPSCVLVLNKADCTRPRVRLQAAESYFRTEIANFDTRFSNVVYKTSAYTGQGVRELRSALLDYTTTGEFEADAGTVHLDDDIDLIRQHVWEKLLHRVHKEVPYRCFFETEEFRELPNGELFVSEIIRAPSRATSLKVIGKDGCILKWIRETAEHSISEVLGRPVRLKLTVAVAKRRNRTE